MISETVGGVIRFRMHKKKDDFGELLFRLVLAQCYIFTSILTLILSYLDVHVNVVDTRGRVKADPWKELGGEYCRFCLFKENRETMEALNFLTGVLR